MPATRCYIFLLMPVLLCACGGHSEVRQERKVESGSRQQVVYHITPAVRITETYLDQRTSLISWGDSSYSNTDSFGYGGNFHFGELPVDTFDTEFIYLLQGCGQTCNLLTILPLHKGAHKKEFLSAEAYDIANRIVAYMPGSNPKCVVDIVIEKYATGEKRNLIINERLPAPGEQCVRDCRFENGRFWVGYEVDRSVIRRRSYDTDSLFKQ